MRKASLVLVVLGAFLIVLAPMSRYYAYPRLATTPVDQNSVTTLVAKNATIFDVSSLKDITTDLTTKVRTIGDAKGSAAAPGGTVVWVNSTSTRSSDGVMRSREVERMAFNAHTGIAVNCCGEFISDSQGVQTPVKHEGLVVKFPFDTQRQTYDFWDGSLRKAVPIKYVRTTAIDGVRVYEFSQTIPPTKTGTTAVPAGLLGTKGNGNVTADQMYSNVRTLWVEPSTGVIIKRSEAQDNTLDYNGRPRLTTTKATTGYDAATVKSNADKYGSQGQLLHVLRSTGPLVALILGVLLLLIGLVLGRRPKTEAEPGTRPTAQTSVGAGT